jgi:hypothetical protein
MACGGRVWVVALLCWLTEARGPGVAKMPRDLRAKPKLGAIGAIAELSANAAMSCFDCGVW